MIENNLHVTMSGFQFGSRILKETATLVDAGLVERADVAAIHEPGLAAAETIDANRSIWRARLRTKSWPRTTPVQILKYLEFCGRVIGHARRQRVTMVNVHNLALLPLGVVLKWTSGARLVYDAHELETETYGLTGYRQTLARLIERSLIRFADLTIVVGGGIEDWYRRAYGLTNIVTVMNCPPFRAPERTRRLHQDLGIPADRRIVLYQGVLSTGRGLELLLKAFAGQDDGHHVLVMMGFGELEPLIKEYAAAHANIFLKEAVDPDVVLEYTASADVGVAYIANSSINDRLCLPNKLFEYIMAGLPVLVNDAPEMRRVVTERQIGLVLSELTGPSLRAALDELATWDAARLSARLAHAAQSFCWRTQADAMVGAYETHVFPNATAVAVGKAG